jgi:hypothetical protein
MSLMTPSTEAGLFTPPVLAALVFVLGWQIEKMASGRVSPARARALTRLCVALLIICYVIVWWREIGAAWVQTPVLTAFFGLGIATATTFLIVVLGSQSDKEDTLGRPLPQRLPTPLPRRIFSWIIIVWGIAGLVGGIVTIAHNALSH